QALHVLRAEASLRSATGRRHSDVDDFAFGMVLNAQDHIACRRRHLPGAHAVSLPDTHQIPIDTPAVRIVCIVEGGILQEVLSDADVEVYHIDREEDAETKESGRRDAAGVLID